jgi:hypothetical protein
MARQDTGPVPYPLALVITLVVEVPIYGVVLHLARVLPGWRGLGAAVVVNLATHPVLWLVLSAQPGWFVPAEAGVCVVEAALLWLLAGSRTPGLLLVAAIAANTASVLAGAALSRFS